MSEDFTAGGQPRRLLFCSNHSYFDPSSGAALATRDLLELLRRRGWDCRAFCGPLTDFEQPEPIEQLLSDHHLAYEVRPCATGSAPFTLFRFVQGGVPVTLYQPSDARPYRRPPTPAEGYPFLALLERLLDRDRPDVLLTFGGDWLTRAAMACARRRGVRVAFALHNFEYHTADPFRDVDAVLVPSQLAREHYGRTLGLRCTPIPGPWDWARVRCPAIEGRYVTFVNPQPEKGVFVFARIAHELWRRRPDIPLLVVEARARAGWLGDNVRKFAHFGEG
jgi:hypothetical protein